MSSYRFGNFSLSAVSDLHGLVAVFLLSSLVSRRTAGFHGRHRDEFAVLFEPLGHFNFCQE